MAFLDALQDLERALRVQQNTLEQLICGWQNGFEGPEDRDDSREAVL